MNIYTVYGPELRDESGQSCGAVSEVIEVVTTADHAAALAEKDQRIAELEAAQTPRHHGHFMSAAARDMYWDAWKKVADLRTQLTAAQADAARNADAAEALAGLEELGPHWNLYYEPESETWFCANAQDPFEWGFGPTPLAAINAAKAAKEEMNP
jgi:hypothetical protein